MDRKLLYKHTSETTESIKTRQRTEKHEIRKDKRNQLLSGKRMRLEDNEFSEYDISLEDVRNVARTLSTKSDDVIKVLTLLRRAFTQGSALIDAFISVDNALSSLIGVFTGLEPEVQLDAAWCLTNMSAGTDEQAIAVIKSAGPYLITYLSSGNSPLQDQCAWAIGNLAGGSKECRDLLRSQGAESPLINLLRSTVSSVVRSAAFALSNMARDNETKQSLATRPCLESLAVHLVFSPDQLDVLAEVSWVLTYLSASGDFNENIFDAGIPDHLISLIIQITEIDADNFLVLTPMMRCLGNLACSTNDVHFNQDQRLFTAIAKLLRSQHLHICKETLWVISNLTASVSSCQNIQTEGIYPAIVSLLSSTFDIRREAAICLCNIASQGPEFCRQLLADDSLKSIVPLIKITEPETAHLALCLIEMLFEGEPQSVTTFEEHGGLSGLEVLEYCNIDQLSSHTAQILERFFYKDDE